MQSRLLSYPLFHKSAMLDSSQKSTLQKGILRSGLKWTPPLAAAQSATSCSVRFLCRAQSQSQPQSVSRRQVATVAKVPEGARGIPRRCQGSRGTAWAPHQAPVARLCLHVSELWSGLRSGSGLLGSIAKWRLIRPAWLGGRLVGVRLARWLCVRAQGPALPCFGA